jgi:uncharacterized protein YifE (UPF0438 family)
MVVPQEHRDYLERVFYSLCFDLSRFSEQEKKLLIRYGHWLEALAKGKIQPITPAQERFVKTHKGEESPQTPFEIAWKKLRDQRSSEAARGLTLEHARLKEKKYEEVEPGFGSGPPSCGFASDEGWMSDSGPIGEW